MPPQGKAGAKGPCPYLCSLVPVDVPAPEHTYKVLHPRKDVFVLKVSIEWKIVAKVSANGERRCRMELELVTPKAQSRTPPYRLDTRETQCDPECPCCECCSRSCRKKKRL